MHVGERKQRTLTTISLKDNSTEMNTFPKSIIGLIGSRTIDANSLYDQLRSGCFWKTQPRPKAAIRDI